MTESLTLFDLLNVDDAFENEFTRFNEALLQTKNKREMHSTFIRKRYIY